jgi:protein-tyrosine phosphatase
MIDLHTHILPGVDDGAATIEDSLDMARAAVADGVRVLAATPHVRNDWPTAAETMELLVAELRAQLDEAGVPVDLRGGGEIALDHVDRLGPGLTRFGLGGNPAYILLEFPYVGWLLGLPQQIHALRLRGVTPVLAHPERHADVQADPETLRPSVDAGALVQVTAASLDGRLGRRPSAAGHELVARGLAHMIASDAHMPSLRGIGMGAAAESLGDDTLAEWLTVGVPEAIVEDRPLPQRPAAAERPRRRLFGF